MPYSRKAPTCIEVLRRAYPAVFPPIKEIATGLDLARLNAEYPLRAQGPPLTAAPFYRLLQRADILAPPSGFVPSVDGDSNCRQERRQIAPTPTASYRSLNDLCRLPPTLGVQRVYLVAFGGRRRTGDIVGHLNRYIFT